MFNYVFLIILAVIGFICGFVLARLKRKRDELKKPIMSKEEKELADELTKEFKAVEQRILKDLRRWKNENL